MLRREIARASQHPRTKVSSSPVGQETLQVIRRRRLESIRKQLFQPRLMGFAGASAALQPQIGEVAGAAFHQVAPNVDERDPLSAIVDRARELTWTRDPFDRLLVAHALLHEAAFVTHDRRIHEHLPTAVW